MMNRNNITQQAKNFANQEVKKTMESVATQITGSEQSDAPNEAPAVDTEEIKKNEEQKLSQLRQRLENEIQLARKNRESNNQAYEQKVEEQMRNFETQTESAETQVKETQNGPILPPSVKGKQGTGESAKIRKG